MAPSRIDELRRRVQNDPASIAFAQLAEEYRRSGQTEEAVRVCREGLTRHPGYLSARVTLGRALLDLGQLDGAREELEFVVAEAPENLAAVRGLAEIFHREGQTAEALSYYQRALALARHDPEIEEIVQQLSRQVGAAAASPNSGLSFEEAHQELLSAAERLPVTPPQDAGHGRNADLGSTAPFDFDRLVAALGTPAAPPQVEAAVAGMPSTVSLDLPEPSSLGPDPFAALEAELRANEAALPAAKAAPWSSPGTGEQGDAESASPFEPASSPFDALADHPAPPADALADTLAEARPFDTADGPAPDAAMPSDEPWAAAAVDPFQPSQEPPAAVFEAPEPVATDWSMADPDAEPAPAREPAPTVAPATTTAGPASEGVLDELESWLTTLQDRSSQ